MSFDQYLYRAGGHEHRRVGEVYFHAGKVWRRGVGIIYVAHPSPPFMTQRWLKRLKKRQRRSQ